MSKKPPPFELSMPEVLRALTDDSNPWNRARQVFRFRSAAIDNIKDPIEQRRQEFYAVLEIVQTVLEDPEGDSRKFLDSLLASAEKMLRESTGSTTSETVIAAATRREERKDRQR